MHMHMKTFYPISTTWKMNDRLLIDGAQNITAYRHMKGAGKNKRWAPLGTKGTLDLETAGISEGRMRGGGRNLKY